MTDTMTPGERIAFRSTKGEGRFAKRRWSELAIYYDPAALGGNVFTAEAKGCSDVPGELERVTRLSTRTLERALAHFDDGRGMSTPARMVADQARVWLERSGPVAAPLPTYSEKQRQAAAVAVLDVAVPCTIDMHTFPSDVMDIVDAVAAALGMQRETARG